MDIICAKCGEHFSSIESAREHYGQCKVISNNTDTHYSSTSHIKSNHNIASNSTSTFNKLTPEELDNLTKILGQKDTVRQSDKDSIIDKKKPSINDNSLGTRQVKNRNKPPTIKLPKWIIAISFILVCTLIGITINFYIGEISAIFILSGFSVIFSINKWLVYYTRKNKFISKLYRIILNLYFLSVMVIMIRSFIELFSYEFNENAWIGSVLLIAEIILFIWLWTIVRKNSWRWPSMKLTITSIVVILAILAFAGIEPISTYKDKAIDYVSSSYNRITESIQNNKSTLTQSIITNANQFTNTITGTFIQTTNTGTPSTTTTNTSIQSSTTKTSSTSIIITTGINTRTGTYKNYYLGLVKSPEGVITGTDCYSEFIVLINNKNAKNPTYSELLTFLQTDNTDNYPYKLTPLISGLYQGSAESHIDLDVIKDIIDGIRMPDDPCICADFAERLHNNAEKAGIRCGYVSLDLDDGIGHALNVFETIDRGIIYIDDTGTIGSSGPLYNDAVVQVLQIGEEYNPSFLFPSGGWYIPEGEMGVVTDIFITWDGEWN